jgi:hypothetical protein
VSVLDESLRNVVAVAFSILDRMRRGQPVSLVIVEQARQQARVGCRLAVAPVLAVGPQLRLDLLPQVFRYDGLVIARKGLAKVGNLTEVEPIV